ncbi:plastocyanin [Microbacterium sp. TS-1]|uniref:DUF7882 domain-containing protein n=1 Tax=Microbacterium arborescens TaxID=33883 RepID=A0ABX2WJ29_9MICO|nr:MULTISPECIES: hypothetical protein [Microbacterium]OAZ41109.1 hypothetical protein A9Z40_04035 [Microbacterium arborescens]GAD33893.1 plastocyanin [Microbacterium sp. TS-1]
MGLLRYGSDLIAIPMPDDVLAHLQLVIAAKLGAGEGFTVSWRHGDGQGRSTLWLERSIPLRFDFASSRPVSTDPRRVRAMLTEAAAVTGLSLGTLPVEAS